ncbi:MAG: RagB/SusD family nutrient uptake outer membrane protein [Gemmatimonadota bacterium]|nr:RagB/SusD family nutrient uptake outer membrane protein [Gemmatimonadota bacterium]
MKKLFTTVMLAGSLALTASCKDFLDVNTNPNAPQAVSANLYLQPMLHWWVSSPQWDGRFVMRYTQQMMFVSTSPTTWDRMGYDPGSDNGAQQWRDVYWSLGQNLKDMMTQAEAEQRWDVLGVGYILKGWGWMVLTDLHGEIIVKEAIDQTKFYFNYDSQEYAYQETLRLYDEAIKYLSKTDGAVNAAYLGKSDKIFAGDRTKWLKVAYGLKAIALNHFSNKSTYKPADVIAAVDASLASNADDALLAFPALVNDDRNFYGPTRGNLPSYRQTQFVVGLMNGTQWDGAVDPRMSRMLSPSPDGVYRGLDPALGTNGALSTTQRPNNVWGYATSPAAGTPTRYFFDDKSKFPAITYAQLQFVKAEAAYKMGDKATALTAFKNGIAAHFDFVNSRNLDAAGTPLQITAAEKAAYLADPRVVPATSAGLTLTHIMTQKYIAQWGWGHNEVWMDMRRYHYTDIDPASGRQVFPGFVPPSTTLYGDNAGKLVQRIRPRYNSEYVWNLASLKTIGGDAADYHTKPLWITQP